MSITTVPGHPDNAQYAEWRKLLKDTFPNDDLSVFNLMGIAAAEVFGKVLEAAGKDLTREKFLAAYNTIDNFKSSIYPGPITCKGTHKCNREPGLRQAREQQRGLRRHRRVEIARRLRARDLRC